MSTHLAFSHLIVAQLAVVIVISVLLGFVMVLFYERFLKLTDEEKAKQAQQRQIEAEQAAERVRVREAEYAAMMAELAARPKPPATVRGGLIKAGGILTVMGIALAIIFGLGVIEVLILPCGVVVLVVGLCLPSTEVAPHHSTLNDSTLIPPEQVK